MFAKGFLLKAGMACAALVRCAGSAVSQEVSIAFEETGEGSYKIEGSFRADVSSRTAWEVLTDYDRIADFVSSLRSSSILERRGDHLLLEQVAVGRILIFSRKVRVILDVHEAPLKLIAFEDISGEDFGYYTGSWGLESSAGTSGLRVLYRLEARRKFAAPDFVARGILKKNARSLLDEVRKEMLRRAARPPLSRSRDRGASGAHDGWSVASKAEIRTRAKISNFVRILDALPPSNGVYSLNIRNSITHAPPAPLQNAATASARRDAAVVSSRVLTLRRRTS